MIKCVFWFCIVFCFIIRICTLLHLVCVVICITELFLFLLLCYRGRKVDGEGIILFALRFIFQFVLYYDLHCINCCFVGIVIVNCYVNYIASWCVLTCTVLLFFFFFFLFCRMYHTTSLLFCFTIFIALHCCSEGNRMLCFLISLSFPPPPPPPPSSPSQKTFTPFPSSLPCPPPKLSPWDNCTGWLDVKH